MNVTGTGGHATIKSRFCKCKLNEDEDLFLSTSVHFAISTKHVESKNFMLFSELLQVFRDNKYEGTRK